MNLEIGTKFVCRNTYNPKHGVVTRIGLTLSALSKMDQEHTKLHYPKNVAKEHVELRIGNLFYHLTRDVAEATCYPDVATMAEAFRAKE